MFRRTESERKCAFPIFEAMRNFAQFHENVRNFVFAKMRTGILVLLKIVFYKFKYEGMLTVLL
jgi:hypothetical protein